jgi:hypothetical protein
MKNGIQKIEGLKIIKAEGGRSGVTLVLSDGSTLEITAQYEGGINIERTAEQTVTEKKLVTEHLD